MTIIRKLIYLLVALSLLATAGWLIGAPAQLLAHMNIYPNSSAILLLQALGTSFLFAGALSVVLSRQSQPNSCLHWGLVVYLLAIAAESFLAGAMHLCCAIAFGGAAGLLILVALPWSKLSVARSTSGDVETGTVKWFNRNKGFGFIRTDAGEEIFVHSKALDQNGPRALREGQLVEFTVHEDAKGLQAENVKVISQG